MPTACVARSCKFNAALAAVATATGEIAAAHAGRRPLRASMQLDKIAQFRFNFSSGFSVQDLAYEAGQFACDDRLQDEFPDADALGALF